MSLLVMQAVSSADFERSTEKVGNGRVNWGAGYIEARGEALTRQMLHKVKPV
jgi:hypothetical protein